MYLVPCPACSTRFNVFHLERADKNLRPTFFSPVKDVPRVCPHCGAHVRQRPSFWVVSVVFMFGGVALYFSLINSGIPHNFAVLSLIGWWGGIMVWFFKRPWSVAPPAI